MIHSTRNGLIFGGVAAIIVYKSVKNKPPFLLIISKIKAIKSNFNIN